MLTSYESCISFPPSGLYFRSFNHLLLSKKFFLPLTKVTFFGGNFPLRREHDHHLSSKSGFSCLLKTLKWEEKQCPRLWNNSIYQMLRDMNSESFKNYSQAATPFPTVQSWRATAERSLRSSLFFQNYILYSWHSPNISQSELLW